MAERLFIFYNSGNGDGLQCAVIDRAYFATWMHEQTDGIRPEHHPVFVDTMPNENSPSGEFCVIAGDIIVPKAVQVVTHYTLE